MKSNLINGVIKFLNALPTTKIRILVSLGMTVYVIHGAVTNSYIPTMEVLGFLLVSQGIDVTQYTVKQKLSPEPTVVPQPVVAPSPGKPVEPVVPTQPTNISDLG